MISTFCRLTKQLDRSLTTTVHSLSLLFIQKHQPPGVFCLLLGIFSLMGNHVWSVCTSVLMPTIEFTGLVKAIRLLMEVSKTPNAGHCCPRGRCSETELILCRDKVIWDANPKIHNHNFSATDILRTILLRAVTPSSLFGLFNILFSS